MSEETPTHYHRIVGIVLGMCAISLGTYAILSFLKEPAGGAFRERESGAEDARREHPFEGLVLEARAVFVLDTITDTVLFQKNAEAQLPLASLTKLMTALVAYETLPENARLVVGVDAIREEGDSGLLSEEAWTLADLSGFTLMVSSNDGAAALAAAAGAFGSADPHAPAANKSRFVSRMNETAAAIGLSQTYFVNETGLDTHEYVSGSYGSARDVARLLEYILNHAPQILEATRYRALTFQSESGTTHSAINTNDALANIPAPLGSKTGFTNLAGGNLIVAFDAGIGRPIIIVVLGSTEKGRFRDVVKLVNASLITIAQ